MKTAKHLRALGRQMLLDAGTEGEMRASGVDQNAEQAGFRSVLHKRRVERAYRRGVEDVRLGPVEPQAQQGAVALEPDF